MTILMQLTIWMEIMPSKIHFISFHCDVTFTNRTMVGRSLHPRAGMTKRRMLEEHEVLQNLGLRKLLTECGTEKRRTCSFLDNNFSIHVKSVFSCRLSRYWLGKSMVNKVAVGHFAPMS